MAAKQLDWEAIERAYRAGQLSVRAIAAQHGINEKSIRNRAAAGGWQRDLADQVRKEVRNKLVRSPQSAVRNPLRASADCGLDAQIVEVAAEEGAQVVRTHRRDIRKASDIADLLMCDLMTTIRNREAIEEAIEAETEPGMLRANMLAAVALPSNAKTLFQLSAAMKNLQTLERQAYNLDDEKESGPAQDWDGKVVVELVEPGTAVDAD
ncbi:hypothetical protein [Azotobacter salinestris]|uniref:hypothetical protein n=1 Tax=Azotobacter salinestris TaxID=69964 RepID=UPI001266B9D2|nr:hypothetical protein [Azotobacter salinestris]